MQLRLLCTRHDSIDSIGIEDLGPLNVPTSILALSGHSNHADEMSATQGSNPIIAILASPQAKAVLAGIAAMVVKRVMQGSPIAA
jgi:hypothetical protein